MEPSTVAGMERMSENLFKFDFGSPANARGTGNFKGLSKKKIQRFSKEKCGIKEPAELYSEASVQNEYLEMPRSVDCSPLSMAKEIKSKVGRIKRRIEAKTNVISFQKLSEAVSPIFRSLNDLETRITKQICRNQASWNHNSRLKKMEQFLQEQLLQEIKLLVHQDGDIQRQRLKDIHSDIMAIKSTMKAMTREKYNCCSCFSPEKECVRYFVEEPTSAKSNFSEKHTEHVHGKETSEEVLKDFAKYDKDTKVPTNEDFHETLLQKHQFDDLQQVPCSIDPCHSHKMVENIGVDIENNLCSLRKGHEAGDQQTGKEGENAEIIMPDKYCNNTANIPVCNARPVEINIQNELLSLQEVCEAGEPEIGNGKETASIDMPHIDCNDGADIQDNLSRKDKVGDKACPSNAQLKTKLKKFDICMPAQEQDSTKCENGNNRGTECKMVFSPRTMRSNLFSETVTRSKNKSKYSTRGTLHNKMGTELSSSLGDSNRCDHADIPQTNEGMNQFDKGITREQNLEDRDPKNVPGNTFSDCVQNKDVSLNSNDHEKQISNKVENTNAFGEQQTEQQISMKKRKSPPDPKQMPTNGKHHPAKKAAKSEAVWLRRPSHRFHESEVECLIAAVENFGTGRWKDIKEKYFSTFQLRTAADLKDKWRSLLHSAANLADNHKFRATVSVNLLKRVLAVHEKV